MFEPKQNNVSPKINICIDTLTFFTVQNRCIHTQTDTRGGKMEKQSKIIVIFCYASHFIPQTNNVFLLHLTQNLFAEPDLEKNLDDSYTHTNCGSKIIIDMSSKLLSSQFHSLFFSSVVVFFPSDCFVKYDKRGYFVWVLLPLPSRMTSEQQMRNNINCYNYSHIVCDWFAPALLIPNPALFLFNVVAALPSS